MPRNLYEIVRSWNRLWWAQNLSIVVGIQQRRAVSGDSNSSGHNNIETLLPAWTSQLCCHSEHRIHVGPTLYTVLFYSVPSSPTPHTIIQHRYTKPIIMRDYDWSDILYFRTCENLELFSKSDGSADFFHRIKLHQPLHRKYTIPKIRNKYSQKNNCGASVPIFAFMCLWAIYMYKFPRSAYSAAGKYADVS